MDRVRVQATMTKAEDPCTPQGEQSLISLAAQFFAPDYVPKMSIGEWRKEQENNNNNRLFLIWVHVSYLLFIY